MASITQSTSIKNAIIWMGDCEEEECEDFDLSSYSLGGENEGVINLVYQLGLDNAGRMFNGNAPSAFTTLNSGGPKDDGGTIANGSSDANKLLCGKAYYIQLSAANAGEEKTVNIVGAVISFAEEARKGRVFNTNSSKPQFLGDVSNLPSCIAKGEFRNLITNVESGLSYSAPETITPDKDGIYIKSDGSVHRIFSGKPFEIPAGSKLLKGKFGVLDTDGDGVPDAHDNAPSTSDREAGASGSSGSTGSSGSSGSTGSAQVSFLGVKPIKIEGTDYPDFNQEYNHVGGRLPNWATDPSYDLSLSQRKVAGTMGWEGYTNPSGGWPVYQGVQNPSVYIMKVGFSTWRIGYRGTAQWSNTPPDGNTHLYAIDFDLPSMGVSGGTENEQLQEAAARSGWYYAPGGNANVVTGVPITATVID